MKLKKVLAVLFTSMMLLTVPQAAFATDITPFAAGFADTKEQAFPITPTAPGNIAISMSLSSLVDEDWYKWTNNTGTDKYLGTAFSVLSDGNGSKYVLGHEIVYANGISTGLVYSESGTGIRFLVPPGATIYLNVEAKKFVDPSTIYWLFLVDLALN